MRTARWIALLAGTASFAAASAVVGEAPAATTSVVDELLRPAVLPTLWASLDESEQDGDLEATVAKARTLLRLVPEWVDGHRLYAGMLAFELSQRAPSTTGALAKLSAALTWLRDAADELAAPRPDLAAEILMARASFLEIRSEQDRDLAAAIQTRFGMNASELAQHDYAEAERLRPDSSAVQKRRAWHARSLVVDALRGGDVPRARARIAPVTRLLYRLGNPAATAAAESLDRLARFWDGDGVSWSTIAADPLLDDVVELLDAPPPPPDGPAEGGR